MNDLLRRFASLAAAVMMCFALTVPAFADELVSGTITVTGSGYLKPDSPRWDTGGSKSLTNGGSAANVSPFTTSYCSRFGWKRVSFVTPSDEGAYGIYFSYYMYNAGTGSQNHVPSSSDFSLYYKSSMTSGYSYNPVSVKLFDPGASSTLSATDGVTISARFENSLSNTVSSVYLLNGDFSAVVAPSWTLDSPAYGSDTVLRVTSVSYVSTETSSELDSLESIADSISQQNELLSAYYGDIVAICNQIYQRLGDMQQTQQQANALLSSLVSLLDTTNGKISALNQAMSTYFELVLKSLQNESLSIQDCINDAELRLETYLKPIVDYFTELEETTGESASTLPGHKTDLDKWSSDNTGIDADAQTGLAAVLPVLSAFSFIFQIIGIFIGLGILKLIIKKGLS